MNYQYYLYIAILYVAIGQAISTENHYLELQKRPAYAGMSFVEIAAVLDDFPALSFFKSLNPTQSDLIKAQAILENKIKILKENPSPRPKGAISITQVASSHTDKLNLINQTENMIKSLEEKIKMTPPIQ